MQAIIPRRAVSGPLLHFCWFSLCGRSRLVQISLLDLSPLMHSQAQQASLALANKHACTKQDLVSQVALRLSLKTALCACSGNIDEMGEAARHLLSVLWQAKPQLVSEFVSQGHLPALLNRAAHMHGSTNQNCVMVLTLVHQVCTCTASLVSEPLLLQAIPDVVQCCQKTAGADHPRATAQVLQSQANLQVSHHIATPLMLLLLCVLPQHRQHRMQHRLIGVPFDMACSTLVPLECWGLCAALPPPPLGAPAQQTRTVVSSLPCPESLISYLHLLVLQVQHAMQVCVALHATSLLTCCGVCATGESSIAAVQPGRVSFLPASYSQGRPCKPPHQLACSWLQPCKPPAPTPPSLNSPRGACPPSSNAYSHLVNPTLVDVSFCQATLLFSGCRVEAA